MTRKFIIVFVITTLFTALVCGFSWIYLSQFLRQRLLWADETASQLTNQLECYKFFRGAGARLGRL